MPKKKRPRTGPQPSLIKPDQMPEFRSEYPTTNNKVLCLKYNLTIDQLYNLAKRMGLRKTNWLWTEKDKQYLRDNFFCTPKLLTAVQIAKNLRRPKQGVYEMIRELKEQTLATIDDSGE